MWYPVRNELREMFHFSYLDNHATFPGLQMFGNLKDKIAWHSGYEGALHVLHLELRFWEY